MEHGPFPPVRVVVKSCVSKRRPRYNNALSRVVREEMLRTLLDVLRRALAVKVDALDPEKQLDLVEQTKPRLLEGTVWCTWKTLWS